MFLKDIFGKKGDSASGAASSAGEAGGLNNRVPVEQIVTRFAPSPTGLLHAGNYRTAVFSYLFARQNKGKFILRIEDTDKARYKPEFGENIIESLEWLGLEYDEKYIQSERVERHKELLRKLINEGKAYISKEQAKDGSGVTKEIVRLRNPRKVVTFTDLIRGDISVDTTDDGDFVIARSVDDPLFHFAVVVDDADMGITHITRGEDHISNTPKHLLIYEALGFMPPIYAHLPLVFGTDKKKLSKRHGAKAMTEYRDAGYLPQALLNAMAMTGWHPEGHGDSAHEQELFEKHELIEVFDLSRVQKGNAIFDPVKVDWYNREHIKRLGFDLQMDGIKNFLPDRFATIGEDLLRKLVPVITERITSFSDVQKMADDGELDYFIAKPEINLTKLSWKGEGNDLSKKHLEKALGIFETVSESDWNALALKDNLWPYAEEVGKGNVLWPIRFALSGRDKSPDPFQLADILGKSETISRINHVLTLI